MPSGIRYRRPRGPQHFWLARESASSDGSSILNGWSLLLQRPRVAKCAQDAGIRYPIVAVSPETVTIGGQSNRIQFACSPEIDVLASDEGFPFSIRGSDRIGAARQSPAGIS